MFRHALASAAIALLALPSAPDACPAIPVPVDVSQPDGYTFAVEVEGDERLHFVREIATGFTVVQSGDGVWWYADRGGDGRLVPSSHCVGAVDPAKTELRTGIVPDARDVSPPPAAREAVRPPRARSAKADGLELTAATEVIALMCQFQGTPGVNTSSYWNDLLFGPAGSLAHYYAEVSYGQFAIAGDVRGWQTMPRTLAAYDGDPNVWTHLVPDAVAAFDAAVDFSQYDGDGDGLVDHLMLVCAGDDPSDGSGTGIWPRMSWSASFVATGDGVEIGSLVVVDDYTFAAGHRASLGTVCHEFGHNLAWPMGFADLYDTDSGSITSADHNDYPVRHWCLMGEGAWAGPSTSLSGSVPAHPNGFHRMLAGWITPVTLKAPGAYSLSPIGGTTGTRLYKVPVAAKPQEFFLLEFRKAAFSGVYDKYSLWCTYAGAYPPLDPGLLVTKVDSTMWARAVQNIPNGGTPSYAHYAVEAVDSGFAGYGGASCPDTVVTRNESRTSAPFSIEDGAAEMVMPLSDRPGGGPSGIALGAIGSGAGSTISFTLSRGDSPLASRLILYDDSFPYATFYSAPGRMRGVRFDGPATGTTFGIDRAYLCFSSAGLPANVKVHVLDAAGASDLITPFTIAITAAQAFPMWREVDLSGYTALRNLPSGTAFMIAIEYVSPDVPYLWFDPFTGEGRSYDKPPAGTWSVASSGGPIDYMIRAEVTTSGLVPVQLTSFQARAIAGGVRLDWSVIDPIDHAGFWVHRSGPGADDWAVLNERLVQAHQGQYSYFDDSVIPGNRYRYRLSEVDRNGHESPMGLVEVQVPLLLPPHVEILEARPNPTGGVARLRLTMSWAGMVQINVYDPAGRRIRRLMDGMMEAGAGVVEWDGLDDLGKPVGSGVYFVRASGGGRVLTEKLTVIR